MMTPPNKATATDIRAIRERNAAIKPETDTLDALRAAVPQFFDKNGNFLRARFDADLAASGTPETRDGYRLSFVGKDYARLQSGLASEKLLVPDTEHNALPDNANSGNLFLTGDNLEALRHLQNAYAGKVKVIYIDPPYNTGQEFVYSDQFEWKDEDLKERLGYSDEEIKRLHSINGKASHSAWLTFMYPRLKLARRLLSHDGVIFISIDDNEQANLRLLMDEIFGEQNFVANITIRCNPKGRSQDKYFATNHEFLLVFSKNELPKGAFSIKKDEDQIEQEYPLLDQLGKYRLLELRNTHREFGKHNRTNLFYPFYVSPEMKVSLEEKTGFTEVWPIWSDGFEGCWTWSKDKADDDGALLAAREVNGNLKIYRKDYANDAERMLKTILMENTVSTEYGQRCFAALLDEMKGKIFEYPKSPLLIKNILQTSSSSSDIILDFFAGSGTTAQAVMELNAEDGGNRQWILCQLDEPTKEDSEARKAGYETIDQISRERIKRAAAKIREDNPMFPGDLGFRHYRIEPPAATLITEIEAFEPGKTQQADLFEGMAEKLGVDAILATWMVADGYPLTEPVTSLDVAGYAAHYLDNSLLYIIAEGWGTEQTKALCNLVGERKVNLNTIIVFGYSLGLEAMRELEINVQQSLNAEVKVEKRY